jgi:thiol-disulfide isomerase/thioredoxin/DNA-binding beta-propeller fold protein YncE
MADEERPVDTPSSPIRAPELSGAVAWLNVPAPLSLKALKGKVVLLDFWTYGCINCIHIIPDLKKLEARFPNELVVIGVHAAKFTNEKATENIRQIIRRYDIRHPVANDAEFRIWRAYTVRAWPSRVIIDPAGYVVGAASGEGNYEGFEEAIEAVIRVFDERGQIDRTPLALALEHEGAAETPLMFPGKVLATADRLFVSDSNHHQIAVLSHDGAVLERIGRGRPGRGDGSFADAEFDTPQGLALIDGHLWVADTNNHLIRSLDFERRTVTTRAGTGVQCTWREEGGRATTVALNSPWDLAVHGPLLFVAMAGPHQIWMMEHARGILWPYAGSGQEARLDGTIEAAAFAQPSGLAIDGSVLYVADAESNIVRAIDLPPSNEVRTLVGGDLFEFGDQDGKADDVRLQHPLGVAAHDGRVVIADTYNHKIKLLDPAKRKVWTLAGTGTAGHRDGSGRKAQFYEPGGVSVVGDTIYVADTNNHAIRAVNARTGETRTILR